MAPACKDIHWDRDFRCCLYSARLLLLLQRRVGSDRTGRHLLPPRIYIYTYYMLHVTYYILHIILYLYIYVHAYIYYTILYVCICIYHIILYAYMSPPAPKAALSRSFELASADSRSRCCAISRDSCRLGCSRSLLPLWYVKSTY